MAQIGGRSETGATKFCCPRANTNFLSPFNKSTRRANHFCLSEIMSSPASKNISVLQKLGLAISIAIPSHSEGRCATSSARVGDAVDVDGAPDEGA